MDAELGALAKIAASTEARVARFKKERPLGALKAKRFYARAPRSLAKAVGGTPPCVIAEVKFASPSEGVLRPGAARATAAIIASAYVAAGASAISILTEPEFFGGDASFLSGARELRPDTCLLMKDFFIDPYQFDLARACGADAVLLIAALLGTRLPDMAAAAKERGLSTLIEVHDEVEAEAALAAGAEVLGVNNRDLRTLKTDLDVSRRLAPFARRAPAAVAESGLRERSELDELRGLGYKGFLIGSAFMKSKDPGLALAALLK
jgi:indole-3-glycerol phosphate synthase